MNDNQILCFLKVAELQSFSKAAVQLYRTQPGISRIISGLEKELGMPLFLRIPHQPLQLTPAGQLYYEAFQNCRNILQETENKVDRIKHDGELHLHFGYNYGWSSSHFLPAMSEIISGLYPYLNLELESGSSHNLIDKLMQHQLDLIMLIRDSVPDDASLDCYPVCELPRIILYHDRLMRSHGPFRTPVDFADIPFCMTVEENSNIVEQTIRQAMESYQVIPSIKSVSNIHTMISQVESGECVAMLDQWCPYIYMPGFYYMPLRSKHQIVIVSDKNNSKKEIIRAFAEKQCLHRM